MRAITSLDPPAEKGTTNVSAWLGHSPLCAYAADAAKLVSRPAMQVKIRARRGRNSALISVTGKEEFPRSIEPEELRRRFAPRLRLVALPALEAPETYRTGGLNTTVTELSFGGLDDVLTNYLDCLISLRGEIFPRLGFFPSL